MELSLSLAFGRFLVMNGFLQCTAYDQTAQSTSCCKAGSPLHCFSTFRWLMRIWSSCALSPLEYVCVQSLPFFFLELCSYTHQFTVLFQTQKQITVSVCFIMKTETNYILRSYLSVLISSDDDDIMPWQLTYDILQHAIKFDGLHLVWTIGRARARNDCCLSVQSCRINSWTYRFNIEETSIMLAGLPTYLLLLLLHCSLLSLLNLW